MPVAPERAGSRRTLVARYGYDVVGRRIAKRVYSAVTGGIVAYTRFVYHGSAVAFETDTTGTKINLRYTWGFDIDDLVAVRDSFGNHYYVVQDKLGSVRGLVKRDGSWIRSLRYRPYGAVVADTTIASPPTWERYRWTGREYDSETGWYYFRARYLDPSVRRFVQEDPIGYAGGVNIYAYGNGSPMEGRDPSGTVMNEEKMGCHICGDPASQEFDDSWGGGGGNDWDGNGVDDFEDFANAHSWDDADQVVITQVNEDGTLSVVTMYVKNHDWNPDVGHQLQLATRAAKAAAEAGLFGVKPR